MTHPTPRQVYDWLAPIREKCPEAWPKLMVPSGDGLRWIHGDCPAGLDSEPAHDLITLHMLRWYYHNMKVTPFFVEAMTRLDTMTQIIAGELNIDLAPWPGGE